MDNPAVRERLHTLGPDRGGAGSALRRYLQKFIEREIDKWAAPIKASGVKEE